MSSRGSRDEQADRSQTPYGGRCWRPMSRGKDYDSPGRASRGHVRACGSRPVVDTLLYLLTACRLNPGAVVPLTQFIKE